MSSTLSEGVRVPDIGSTSWGADVNYNWGLLNTALANISGNVKVDVANTWTAPQTFTETISGSIDGIAARAVGDEDGNNIKTALAGKQPSLSQAQLDAVNSGVTSAAVAQIGTNASNISALQTAVASKAADADVVHLAGAETITGDKKFQGYAYFSKQSSPSTVTAVSDCSMAFNQHSSLVFFQTRGSSNFKSYNSFLWSGYRNSSSSDRYGRIRLYRSMGVYGEDNEWTPDTSFSFIDFAIQYKFVNITENVQVINDGTENAIKPVTNNATDLGTSGNKWKTLNGINPGALSFPANSYVDIDTTGWTAGGTNRVQINGADPAYPGWLFVRLSNIDPATDYCLIRLFGTGNGDMSVYAGRSDKHMMVIAPVPANTAVRVYCSALPAYCRYYVCQGNV